MPGVRGLRSNAGGVSELHVGEVDGSRLTCPVLALCLKNLDNSTRILSERVVRLPGAVSAAPVVPMKSSLTHSQSGWVQFAAMEG